MSEFMKIANIKEQSVRRASGIPDPVTSEHIDELAADLTERGIIDEKGLVRNG